MTPDVVVIGGGPAGLCSAVALARAGLSVVVYERADEPGTKPCGEGLLPRALANLAELGLRHTDLLDWGRPLSGVRYISRAGRRAEGRFREGPGLGLSREHLQRMLTELATSTSGLSLRRGQARLRLGSDQTCRVEVDGRLMTPRLLIGADGLCSTTRKAAGLRSVRPGRARFGARRHFRVAPWTDYVEVHWGKGLEAYVTPTASDAVNVAFLWDESVVQARGGQQLSELMLMQFPELARRLRHAYPVGRLAARGPLHLRVPLPARDGLLLVGDAAGYVDALTGEGVGLSALQAGLLAKHVAPALSEPGPQLRLAELRPFLREVRGSQRAHVGLTRLLLLLRRSPGSIEQLIAALAYSPGLFQNLLSLNQGCLHPWELLSNLPHALCGSLDRELGEAHRPAQGA